MIAILIKGEGLDMYPGTVIQRERLSPFFLSKSSDGKDGIPGEISYPFKLPPSDKNYRLLDWPHILPNVKTKVHTGILENDGMQLSAGRLVMDVIETNLQINNKGFIDAHFLSNASEFFVRIKDKKLKDLSLGGERNFNWAGYSKALPGFWKHIHDTWNYNDSDNGDYVFFTLWNDGYLGGTRDWQNEIRWNAAQGDVEFNPYFVVTALTPAVYVKYILVKIFEEHGYAVSGDLLNDFDFKKLTMQSFYGVYWSDVVFNATVSPPVLVPTPRNNITIKLSEHMPPNVTIAEFLVEMQKLLPIGFDINDNNRTCKIIWLDRLATGGPYNDRTKQFVPSHRISLGEGEGTTKVFGLTRNKDGADNLDETTVAVRDQVNDKYDPGNATDFIESNITAFPMYEARFMKYEEYGGPVRRPPTAKFPFCSIEGSWHGKDGEPVDWKMHFAFYRGRKNSTSDGIVIPLGTNDVKIFGSVLANNFVQVDGSWSLYFSEGIYGLNNFWNAWLKVLGNNETLQGTMNMPLHEYLQLRWTDVLLINNTPYVIQKIKELLPYKGRFDFEAVRKL
jgi:hypothetical protein